MHHDSSADDLTKDSWLGRVLARRYRVVARIGAGGMGVVYRAWDEAIQAYVVVKMPKRELIDDPKFLRRFGQELSVLRVLSHPTIVPINDIGNEQGTPFAVMPYLAGGSLKQRRPMFQDGRVAPEEPAALWRWLSAIAQALDFVHASNYVHRDVKPDNVLFDGPGAPYLSDFGVAKLVFQEENAAVTRGLTGTGFALGTPDYMAPELIGGTKADPRVDQYALAIMTYEMLAGRKPFDGPTAAAVIIAHATGIAPPLASLRPAIPPAISEAVARGMAKNPEDRFDSCMAFAEAVLAHTARPAAAEKLQLMCPECGRLLNVKPDWAGKQGNCPRCKTALTIGQDLRSLWIPADKAALQTPQQHIDIGNFSSPPRPMPQPSPVNEDDELGDVLEALERQITKRRLLQGLVVTALAISLVAMLVVFSSSGPTNLTAKPVEAVMPSKTHPADPAPRVVRPTGPSAPPESGQPRPEAAEQSAPQPVLRTANTSDGGRLYCTSLAATILEAYYRSLSRPDIDAMR